MNTINTLFETPFKTEDFGGFKKFNALLEKISKFAYSTNIRPNINGVKFEFKAGILTLIATNGYQMVVHTINYTNEAYNGLEFTLPLQFIKKIITLKASYSVMCKKQEYKTYLYVLDNNKNTLFSYDAYNAAFECIFPEWQKVLPKVDGIDVNLTGLADRLEEFENKCKNVIKEQKGFKDVSSFDNVKKYITKKMQDYVSYTYLAISKGGYSIEENFTDKGNKQIRTLFDQGCTFFNPKYIFDGIKFFADNEPFTTQIKGDLLEMKSQNTTIITMKTKP